MPRERFIGYRYTVTPYQLRRIVRFALAEYDSLAGRDDAAATDVARTAAADAALALIHDNGDDPTAARLARVNRRYVVR